MNTFFWMLISLTIASLISPLKTAEISPSSDESEPQQIECHFFSDFENSTCCVIQVTSIAGQNYVLQPPENATEITKFDLTNNKKVAFLPQQIGRSFYELTQLNATGNSLKVLTKIEFTRLFRLKILLLDANVIEVVKFNAFDDLITLQSLSLDSNRISSIDAKIFSSNGFLKQLSMRNNQLVTLHEDIFENTPYLEVVRLQRNQISRLSHRLLDHAKNLRKLSLAENSCVDKNYEGKRIGSSFAVDMMQFCEDANWNVVVWVLSCGVVVVLAIVAGISSWIYVGGKKDEMRRVEVNGFENPRFQKKKTEDEVTEVEIRYVNCINKNEQNEPKLCELHVYEELEDKKKNKILKPEENEDEKPKIDVENTENCCTNPTYK